MDVAGILRGKGSQVFTASPGTSIAEAVGLMTSHAIGALVVTEGAAIRGILSERDIVRGLAQRGVGCLDCTASDYMTSPAITCAPGDSDREVMALMTDRRCRHLPVVDGGRLVGMVSIGDIVKSRIDAIVAEADALREYIVRG